MGGLFILLMMPLAIINGINTGQFSRLWYIIGTTNGSVNFQNAGANLLLLLGEFLFIIVIASFADKSRSFGAFSLALAVTLWFVWGVMNPNAASTTFSKLSGNYKPPANPTTTKQGG